MNTKPVSWRDLVLVMVYHELVELRKEPINKPVFLRWGVEEDHELSLLACKLARPLTGLIKDYFTMRSDPRLKGTRWDWKSESTWSTDIRQAVTVWVAASHTKDAPIALAQSAALAAALAHKETIALFSLGLHH